MITTEDFEKRLSVSIQEPLRLYKQAVELYHTLNADNNERLRLVGGYGELEMIRDHLRADIIKFPNKISALGETRE